MSSEGGMLSFWTSYLLEEPHMEMQAHQALTGRPLAHAKASPSPVEAKRGDEE